MANNRAQAMEEELSKWKDRVRDLMADSSKRQESYMRREDEQEARVNHLQVRGGYMRRRGRRDARTYSTFPSFALSNAQEQLDIARGTRTVQEK